MTAAEQDPVWAFLHELPARIKRDLNRTEALVGYIHTAVRDQGWTPAQLAQRCSIGNDGDSAPRIVMFRLKQAASTPANSGNDSPRRVHHGCCENGWIYDESGEEVVATKCPGTETKIQNVESATKTVPDEDLLPLGGL